MPSQRFVFNIPLGQRINNVFEGSSFEFIGMRPARVMIAAVTDTGEPTDFSLRFTDLEVFQPSPLQEVTAGTGPIIPDNVIIDSVAPPGARLLGVLVNRDAATAVNCRILIDVTPL